MGREGRGETETANESCQCVRVLGMTMVAERKRASKCLHKWVKEIDFFEGDIRETERKEEIGREEKIELGEGSEKERKRHR